MNYTFIVWMFLRFDTYTQQKIKKDWNSEVQVTFIQAGCAGQKVIIQEHAKKETNLNKHHQDSGITVWCRERDEKWLDGGQIAIANGKTYFSSPKTKGRCGCGTSISFVEKKIDLSMAKIHALSGKLGELPEIKEALSSKKNTG